MRSIAIKAFIVAKNKSPWTVTAENSLVFFSLDLLSQKRIYRIGWCRIELAHSRLMTIRLQILCVALLSVFRSECVIAECEYIFVKFKWLKDNLCRKNVIHIVMCSFFRQQLFINAYIKYTFTKCSILCRESTRNNQSESQRFLLIIFDSNFDVFGIDAKWEGAKLQKRLYRSSFQQQLYNTKTTVTLENITFLAIFRSINSGRWKKSDGAQITILNIQLGIFVSLNYL